MMANGVTGKHDVSSLSKNMRHGHGYKGSMSQSHRSSQSVSHTSNQMRGAGPDKTLEVYH